MAVDRSTGATVLLSILAGLAAALLPMVLQTHDWLRLLLIESCVVLAAMLLVLVRQKNIRERCVICGSDVETHFLATSLPASQWKGRFNQYREEGPICRICTDLESDRAERYPWLTKFDETKNRLSECAQCHRKMRTSFLHWFVTSQDPRGSVQRELRCKHPWSKRCQEIAKSIRHGNAG